jgi:hypothetical protein
MASLYVNGLNGGASVDVRVTQLPPGSNILLLMFFCIQLRKCDRTIPLPFSCHSACNAKLHA